MLEIAIALIGFLFGVWAIFKYCLLIEVRIDANTFKTLYDLHKKNSAKFIVYEELITDTEYPNIFCAFCWFKKSPLFYLSHYERLLTAGFEGKDNICLLTCFRWSYNKLKKFITNQLKEDQLTNLGIPVQVISPYYVDKIGTLKQAASKPYQPVELWHDIEEEIKDVFSGKLSKTSALLYGPPGNGKTSFIRYIATKYRVPIKIITFSPDFDNFKVLSMFSRVSTNCIVLFEDFDNYFDKRDCVIGKENNNIKFTFDMILNGLDGIYNTYEKVVFIMTVNDIEKVDISLRNRPSRFKFVRHFDNPSKETRFSILGDLDLVEKTENLNLDQILKLKGIN